MTARIVVVVLAIVEAGWMAFEGGRGLISKPDVTTLGPWARFLTDMGINPDSPRVKTFFLIYGLAWLGATAAFHFGVPWMRLVMSLLAACALWYLPVGTILSIVQLVLLIFIVKSVR